MTLDRTDMSLIALRRILRATELHGKELAKAAGLTPVQLRAAQVVAEKGYSTAKEIASRMLVSQATITTLVDKLESQGIVRREPSQTDRRQINIVITDKGRAGLDNVPDALQQRYVRKFEALEDWEQAMLIASLEKIATMLDAGHIEPNAVLDPGDFGSAA